MSKLKYGEFSFPAPTARPTVSGYARGGSTSSAPKSKGQAKVAKLVGMKREPEAMVKKEIALLKKAGAPAKIIKHEERELKMPDAMKKGGKTKYQEGGFEPSSDNVFREKDGKYFHNNQEVSREDFNKRREAVDRRMQQLRGPDRRGMSLRDRAKAAMGDLDAEDKDSFEMIQKREQRPFNKGGKAAYADGGQVSQMVKENARAKNVKPVKPRAPMTDRERMMMEQARGEKMDRQMRDAERQHYDRERAENEADRRAMGDALMYIPRKIGEGARSAYDAVMNSDIAKGARNYGRTYQEGLGMTPSTPYEKKKGGAVHSDVAMDKKVVKKAVHKHEAAMHPGKPMTKLKKGGDVQKYADGGVANYIAAPGAPGGMPTKSAPNAPSAISQLAQNYAAQRNASPAAGRIGMAAPQVAPGRNIGRAPAYAGAVPMGNAPAAASPLSGLARSFAGNRQPGAMKKGGSVKKGVPVHNRNPKC